MTSAEKIKSFREKHKLNQSALADLLEMNVRTLQDWEQERFEPPSFLFRALRDLERDLFKKKKPAG